MRGLGDEAVAAADQARDGPARLALERHRVGEEPLVAGEARREPLHLAVFVAGAAVHVVVGDLLRGDDVHDAQRRVEAARDAGAHEEVRGKLADQLHRADGGVDLSDARFAHDDLVGTEGTETERAVLEGDGVASCSTVAELF